ncbi:hypothetical protein [Vibrio scophthalmi]|uniref:Gp42 n=1 Tax=Vibrio scophthalmi LMG 19158 TaxID=870967 RepID=F9RLQ3_9VIBR|nr:hypothetical protein [Vibrio scophthalmi]EGU38811.1 hypothetical protein VIS19158_04826 [Vibrio scophthalmi LMG 19158]
MKELNEVVSAHLNQMCTDGTLEKMIQEQTDVLVKNLVSRSMETYGALGKAIQAKIDESLQGALNGVTLPECNRFIAETLINAYENAINEQSAKKIKELLDVTFKPIDAVITADDFFEGIKEAAKGWGDIEDQDEIELQWESDNDYSRIEIIIADKTRVTLYDHCSKGKHCIGYLSNNKYVFSGPIFNSTHCFGIDAYLYKLYCARTSITGLGGVHGDNIQLQEW